MIVKMSKYAFMVYHKEYDTFLSTLRDLGVVHIKETNSVMDNERLQELLASLRMEITEKISASTMIIAVRTTLIVAGSAYPSSPIRPA